MTSKTGDKCSELRLAISASSFRRPSETFIAEHARRLRPGKTVLLCHDGRAPAEEASMPVYRYQAPRFRHFGWAGRLPNALLRRLLPGAAVEISGKDRRRAAEFLRRWKVGRVLAEYGPEGLFLYRLCEELNIPLYVHFHGFDASSTLKNPKYLREYRRMFPHLAGVIAPSRFIARALVAAGCPEGQIHVNACGVDPKKFQPAEPEQPARVIAVGRLVPKKAPHLAIRAFAVAAAEHPEATLDLVGDGPLRARCEAEIERLGLQGRVHLHGVVDHDTVARLVAGASVFIQHSVTAENGDVEGLPVGILEAMCAARPVVSTRHSGIPEAVEDGRTGFLVAEHDADAMGRALARLLQDREMAVRMGEAGRARILAEYTIHRSCRRLRGILAS